MESTSPPSSRSFLSHRPWLAGALALALALVPVACTPASTGGAAGTPTQTAADQSGHGGHGAQPAPVPEGEGDGPAQGSAATDFTLRDVDGRTVRLGDYSGKVVLIDFWATWCVPCEAEIPHLQTMYEKYKDDGFVILAISMDGPETIALVPSVARRYNLTFPVLLDEETKVVALYNPKRTAPLSMLIDRRGRISRVRQGYNVGDEAFIESDVKQLLGRSSP